MDPKRSTPPSAHLLPWSASDFHLLEELLGDPQMMTHLGGPERPEKLRTRQKNYETIERVADSSKQRCLKIVDTVSGAGAGWVGYWERNEDDVDGELTNELTNELAYEIGWSVLPAFQGRGFATAAAAQALDLVRPVARHRYLHATPSVDNHASNAICRKLGFELLGASEVEYPPGRFMRANDWRLELLKE